MLPTQCEETFTVSSGQLISGVIASEFDYVTYNADQVSCCASCNAIEGCIAWTLRVQQHGVVTCTLHADTGPDGELRLVENPSAVHGIRMSERLSLYLLKLLCCCCYVPACLCPLCLLLRIRRIA